MPGESREPDLKLTHWLSRINDHRNRLNDPILMAGGQNLYLLLSLVFIIDWIRDLWQSSANSGAI